MKTKPKTPSLRKIVERDKIFNNPPAQAKTCERPGENLERMICIALKRVCVQLGVKYWI